ncbi:hypothetical protein FRC05_009434 [Tulasnella sp. 425]|nr:hypothetical protein FRC05_009434 [Tulasnella sp. 425]
MVRLMLSDLGERTIIGALRGALLWLLDNLELLVRWLKHLEHSEKNTTPAFVPPPPPSLAMTDVAQDPQLNMAAAQKAQTTEQNSFETIRNAIPVQLRPTAVPRPFINLSTERNEQIDCLYRRVEHRSPSYRFADGYFKFIDEVKTVTKSGGFELEFVPEGNIRLSNDRYMDSLWGRTGF